MREICKLAQAVCHYDGRDQTSTVTETVRMQTKGSVVNEISSLYDRLSDREQRVADFMMARQGEIPSMTTREIAVGSKTSAATVSRFARRLGYESYADLREALIRDNEDVGDWLRHRSVISLDAQHAAMETVLMTKHRELVDTLSLVDEGQLLKVVRLLEGATSVQFAAVGNSIPAALNASFLLAQLSIRTACAPTTEAMMLSTLSLTPHDALVFISKSGHSKRLNKMMDNALETETPTVVITNIPESPLAQRATYVLHAATHDKTLSNDLPFSHNSINYLVEVLFLLLRSDVPNFSQHARMLWKSMGEDKGVEREVM